MDDLTDGQIRVRMAETFARLKEKFPPFFHEAGQEDQEWWWSEALCDALEIYDPDRTIAKLDYHSKAIGTVDSPNAPRTSSVSMRPASSSLC